VNPDIVLLSYGGYLVGVVALYSLLHRKKFVFRVGGILTSNLTFDRGTGLVDFGFWGWRVHAFFVRYADIIVTNAEWVADAFRKNVPGKLVQVIPNGLEIVPVSRTRKASYVLWLARMDRVKNPAMFVRLAKELPHIQFVMRGSGRLYQQVAKLASQVANLTLMDLVTGEEKERLLKSALVLINTSFSESFPNTLLEAGMNRVPYVSFVDPDEVICRYELGYHVRSFQQLVEKTALLVNDRKLRARMGRNIRRYVEKNHDIEKAVSKYDHLLRSLLQPSRRTSEQT
jgi:glycosyltransferase involved in cell wall biosynthesis